jgi:hypothetical protein
MASTNIVAELPVGNDGLSGSRNMSQVPITALIKATNVSYESGALQKEGGSSKYNSIAITGSPSVLGGWDWIHDGATQRMIVVLSDGTILKDSGAGNFPVTLKAGLTVNDVIPTFTECGKEAAAQNRKLAIFTGVNAVQILSADGATSTDLSTPPTDWTGTSHPKFGVVHEGRLWGGGNTGDPHRLYYSMTSDHENFTGTGSGTVSVFPGDGEGLIGAVSYKGSLIAFKKRGIYLVDTSSATVSNWRVSKIAGNLGCAGVKTYAQLENDAIFLDQNGEIRVASATQEFGDIGTRSLTDIFNINQFIRDNLNLTTTGQWQFCYYALKRELHIACCSSGSTTNNARFVLDFNTEGKVKFRYSDKDTNVSLWIRKVNNQDELIAGDNAGFVWKLDRDNRSKDGSGYSSEFQTAYFDFSHLDPTYGTKRKNGKFLEVVTEPVGNWNLSVDVYWDGQYTQTVQFNMGSTGAALGSFILGTDRLAGSQLINRKRRVTGSGRRVSFLGKNSGDGQNFSVARFFFHFAVSDERIEA